MRNCLPREYVDTKKRRYYAFQFRTHHKTNKHARVDAGAQRARVDVHHNFDPSPSQLSAGPRSRRWVGRGAGAVVRRTFLRCAIGSDVCFVRSGADRLNSSAFDQDRCGRARHSIDQPRRSTLPLSGPGSRAGPRHRSRKRKGRRGVDQRRLEQALKMNRERCQGVSVP